MSDKMREEFEKEYGQIYLQKEADGSYSGNHAKIAWEYWQKSRAALVVKLPNPAVAHSSVETLYTEDVCNALEDAGVRYE